MSNYKVFYRTEKSADLRHKRNEDCYMHVQYRMMNDEKINVLVVADGMGGLEDGENASRHAVTGVLAGLHERLLLRYQAASSPYFSITHYVNELEAIMREAFQKANRTVCELAEDCLETGTTLSVVLHVGECAVAANIGDSPVYYYSDREKELSLIAKLQTKAELDAQAGLYERFSEEYYKHAHILLQNLGGYAQLPPESVNVEVLEGVRENDMFLLGSDGAFGRLPISEIRQMLEAGDGDLILRKIFFEAKKDKNDDQTAILYQICGG